MRPAGKPPGGPDGSDRFYVQWVSQGRGRLSAEQGKGNDGLAAPVYPLRLPIQR